MDEETLESATKLAARIQEISEGISSVLDGTEATLSEALDVFTYFIGKAVSECATMMTMRATCFASFMTASSLQPRFICARRRSVMAK